ncbi:MAG: Ig-like domain-containing protein [Planctomycetota bacterium]
MSPSMTRSLSVRLVLLLAVVATVGIPIVGCGAGSTGQSGTPADEALFVTYFNLNNRTDVYRNGLLQVDFSAPVKKSSLTIRTFRILTGSTSSMPVEGALIRGGTYGMPGDAATVFFDPTRSQSQVDRYPENTPLDLIKRDRPFGFEALANHRVYLPAPPTVQKSLLNKAGKPIIKEYVASFSTSELYAPELDQPSFIGMNGSGQLGFVPERASDGSVAFDAEIILEFDEPIAQASMNPGVTVLVKNEDVLDYLGRPIDVPGTLKPSNDGLRYYFSPSFHYGTGPYRISVTTTFDIKDLAGNPLSNPKKLVFTTQFNPDVDTISNLTEDFDTNTYEDTDPSIVDRAEWNTVNEGRLVGGEITTSTVIVHYDGDGVQTRNLLVDFPLVSLTASTACPRAWADGCRVMMSYEAGDDLGNVTGAVTQIYWGPSSNALFAAKHENIQIRLGHTTNGNAVLGKKFDPNFTNGVPLAHYDGEYSIPQDADVNIPPGTITAITNHWAWPTITNPFDYNGADHLVVDFQMDSAPDCQTMRTWFHGLSTSPDYVGIRSLLGLTKTAVESNFPDAFYPDGYPMIYDSAFVFRRRVTNAQSKFYDTAQGMPNYGEPILSPPVQSGGASYTIEFQGADGMPHPSNPFRIIPDPLTYTSWGTNIDVADFHRFIRFRIELKANLISETVPVFDQVQMPFSFRPL